MVDSPCKKCSKCGLDKPSEHFYYRDAAKTTLFSQCKTCVAAWRAANKVKKSAYDKAYRQKNKEKITEQKRLDYQKNKHVIADKNKQRDAKWRRRKNTYMQSYYRSRQGLIMSYQTAYRQKHTEKIRQRNKEWRKNNRHITAANNAKRKAAQLERTPNWLTLSDEFEFVCIYTYATALNSIGLSYHVDHIIPLKGKNVSGLHTPENLQVIPAIHNMQKGNRYGYQARL